MLNLIKEQMAQRFEDITEVSRNYINGKYDNFLFQKSLHNMNMKKTFFITLVFILFVWSFVIEPKMLMITDYKITEPYFKGHNFKIVFASDFHIKKNQKKRLEKIVAKINSENPDLVLLGGDFVVGDFPEKSMPVEQIAQGLSKIKSKYGVYSVLGNHDEWYDSKRVANSLKKYGIKVLDNENVKLNLEDNKTLYIVGIEDLQSAKPDLDKAFGLKNKENAPVVFLTHSPDIFLKNPYKPFITLAGHTHGGQVVFPFFGALIVPSSYGSRFASGLIKENDSTMIVSKGVGTSILPLRFNCVPEINVIEFE